MVYSQFFLGGISMNQMFLSQLKSLSIKGLMLLYEDTTKRIGSHTADSESIVHEYIEKQKGILSAIEGELKNRKEAYINGQSR
jgi:hypothetical protein